MMRDAIVLSAGGARAAYQVGVLRTIVRLVPEYRPTIFTGISGGSINACALAQAGDFSQLVEKLYSQWAELRFDDVLRTNFPSVAAAFVRFFLDLSLNRVAGRQYLHSLLDARPLAAHILKRLRFGEITHAIRQGHVHGLAIIATDYEDSATTFFYDAHDDVQPWSREGRRAVRGPIHAKHMIASCAIPFLFSPMKIGNRFYGDGAIRFCFPLSPSIRMGARRILAIATQRPSDRVPVENRSQVGLGFIAGAVLDCVFQDSVQADLEMVNRINVAAPSRKIETLRLRPSRDLGSLAAGHVHEIPFHLRQLVRSSAQGAEVGSLASYLLFSPGYLQDVMKLGEADAEEKAEEIRTFLRG